MKHIKALGFGALCCFFPGALVWVLVTYYSNDLLLVAGALAVLLCYCVGRMRYP